MPARYPIGTRVPGTITSVTDFGVFVELEEGLEGLIHVSQLSNERVEYKGTRHASADFPARHRKAPEDRSWQEQIDHWESQIGELLFEFQRGDVRVFLRNTQLAEGAYAPLTRIYEASRDLDRVRST